jgi:polyisoprenoid-binding protein YceI
LIFEKVNKLKERKNIMALWKIDPAHSEINFKVKHLVVSTVRGHFKDFDASIETNTDDFSDAKISFEAKTGSIETGNSDRDAHLKSADFFYAEKYPEMTFESSSVKKISDYELQVKGYLTIHGTTKEITLHVIYNGTVPGFGGKEVAGFEINGKLSRFDFGLHWNAITEAGGVVVSNEVKIEIVAEFNKVQSVSKAA